MSGLDQQFLRRLRATFELEAKEHVQAIASNLMALEAGASSEGHQPYIETVFRCAHSLKGAARAVNFNEVESICQQLESVFAGWKRDRTPPSADALDVAHRLLDQITATLSPALPEPVPVPVAAEAPARSGTDRSPAAETVRVPIRNLDAQLVEAEELLNTRLAASRLAAELLAVEEQFATWRREWDRIQPHARALRQQPAGAALADYFDWNQDFLLALEARITTLRRAAAQDSLATARRVDSLLASAKGMLMLPLDSLAALLQKVVRDLCRDQGKAATFRMRGEKVEVDKRILEEIKDPLIHLLRNCVDHGIGAPAQRRSVGKAPQAVISVDVSPVENGKVEISISDDGRGIDVVALKSAAVAQQVLTAAQAGALDHDAALELVFQPDVSTSPDVTKLSGRGLGMSIVREHVERLGGSVTVESQPGSGTLFRIRLPVTLTTLRALVVEAAERRFVLPVIDVDRVMRFRAADVKTVEGRETLALPGRVVSLVRLAHVLGLEDIRHTTEFAVAVLLGSGPQCTAFAVDAVLDEQEILVKSLGRPLHRLPHFSGATVLGTGQVVPLLKTGDLLRSARQAGAPEQSPVRTTPRAKQAARILVTEDSITSRMLLKGILEAAGYRVRTAIDGMDAYTILRTEPFDLVVSDVEMPRLDGFGLTTRIRADRRLKDLPVILVTALESREHREHGIEAGANAYVVKSSFDQSNLLEAVRRLI